MNLFISSSSTISDEFCIYEKTLSEGILTPLKLLLKEIVNYGLLF